MPLPLLLVDPLTHCVARLPSSPPSFPSSFLPSSFPPLLPSSLPSFLPSFRPSALPPSLRVRLTLRSCAHVHRYVVLCFVTKNCELGALAEQVSGRRDLRSIGPQVQIYCTMVSGGMQIGEGEFGKAEAALRASAEAAEAVGDNAGYASALSVLSWCMYAAGAFDAALATSHRLIEHGKANVMAHIVDWGRLGVVRSLVELVALGQREASVLSPHVVQLEAIHAGHMDAGLLSDRIYSTGLLVSLHTLLGNLPKARTLAKAALPLVSNAGSQLVELSGYISVLSGLIECIDHDATVAAAAAAAAKESEGEAPAPDAVSNAASAAVSNAARPRPPPLDTSGGAGAAEATEAATAAPGNAGELVTAVEAALALFAGEYSAKFIIAAPRARVLQARFLRVRARELSRLDDVAGATVARASASELLDDAFSLAHRFVMAHEVNAVVAERVLLHNDQMRAVGGMSVIMRVGDVTVEVGMPQGTNTQRKGSKTEENGGGNDALKLALKALAKSRRRERLAEMALDGGGETSFGSESDDNLRKSPRRLASHPEATTSSDVSSAASSPVPARPARAKPVGKRTPRKAKAAASYSESGWNADSDSADFSRGTPDIDSDWALDEGEEEYIRAAAIVSGLRPEKAAIGSSDASAALAPRAEAGESARQTLSRCLARVTALEDVGVESWVVVKPLVAAVWAALHDELRSSVGDGGGAGVGDSADATAAEECIEATIARVVEAAAPRANAAQQRAARDIAAAALVLVLSGEVL